MYVYQGSNILFLVIKPFQYFGINSDIILDIYIDIECLKLFPPGPSYTYVHIDRSADSNQVTVFHMHLSSRCTRRYENHVNRCQPCSAAISPCGRFIATGSEDNCVSRMIFSSQRSHTHFSR